MLYPLLVVVFVGALAVKVPISQTTERSGTRFKLPDVHYPRETDPSKMTPLDTYVNTYDPTSGYSVYPMTYTGKHWTAVVLDFNSGTWQSATSSRPLWQHWITICIPNGGVTENVAMMYMDGPGNTAEPESSLNPEIYMICDGNTKGLTVYLQQIPNEDLSFPDHPQGLGEDALIAYGWRKFLNGSAVDPTWLLRLPMTRAGSSAMTAVQDYMQRFHPEMTQPSGFLVAGASKRGWTTWTLAAVDTRVVAAVPIVMPIPDVVPNIAAEWRAYGNWSFALKDYVHFDIVNYLFATPGVQDIADITGPAPYISRLTIPVWNIIATGDEFTLPDSPRFWWNTLPGEKHLRAVPNAEHSMATAALDVVSDILAFYHLFINNIERPKVNWALEYAGTNSPARITVNASIVPESAKMWWASTIASSGRRDFRLVTCFQIPECLQPVIWFPKDLSNVAVPNSTVPATFVAEQSAPAAGWTGFLIQLDFKMTVPGVPDPVWWRVSTEVNVVPDIFPFPPCPASECNNPPPSLMI